LVYSTCSILPEENEQQIERFLKAQSDAKTIAIDIPYGISQKHGHQCLPTYEGGDGFYYCILTKTKP
jgi:16S rRNA (cytosine967-C5)-methyltransferase